MTPLTHNQFIKLFSDIAITHRDINSFYTGDLDNYTANEANTLNPVTLWVVVNDDNLTGKVDKPKYSFVLLDYVNQDSSNLDEVYSDTLRIAKDIVAILRQPYYESFFKIEESVTFNPFNEKFDSDVAGWQFELIFNQSFLYDACSANTSGLPSINYETIAISTSNSTWGYIVGTLSNQTDLQAALDAKVPTARTLTINGTTYDLSANRSWTVSGGGETLAQTLAIGNTSGSNHQLMNDDYYVGLGTGATNRGKLYRDSANTRIAFEHGTTGDYLRFTDSGSVNLKSVSGNIYADGVGNTVGLDWNESANQIQAFNLNGLWAISTAQLQLWHDAKLNFDAPAYTFNQLTATTVPYLDASKNLVSSAVTPTQLGYLDATSSVQTQLDAKVPKTYLATPTVGSIGYVPNKYYMRQNTPYVLTSTTAVQQLFNGTANGRLTLPVGVYKITAQIYLTDMSATSGNASFSVPSGTATTTGWLMYGFGVDTSPITGISTMVGSGAVTSAYGTNVVSATAATRLIFTVTGSFEVTVAGTVIPSIALTTAASANVGTGTMVEIECLGVTGTPYAGPWD